MEKNNWIDIALKDSLKHEKFQWPLTLLSYPVTFDGDGVKEGEWELVDEHGEAVEFQVSDLEEEDGLVKGLCLHVMSALNTGEQKRYRFLYGTGTGKKIRKEAPDPPKFRLEIQSGEGQVRIGCGTKTMVCHLDFEEISYQEGERGPLFWDARIICRGREGEEYVLSVRRIKDMPFWELSETMRGMTGKKEMRLSFEGFDFTHRQSWQRPVEKIDAYLTDHNRIPVTVMPYENWNPWFQSKYIGFLGEDQSAGVFIRDNLGWDDGSYPLWGSRRDFGITFTYEGDRVDGHFPLKNGTRFVGVSVYDGADPFYMAYLWQWYAFLHLDKTKMWILDWEESQSQYPRFFDPQLRIDRKQVLGFCEKGERIPADRMRQVVDHLSLSMNQFENLNPVDNREFSDWTVITDLTAGDMEQEDFRHVKAAFAFMAYAAMDENYMPTRNMLAGHPNFLCDTAAIPGFAAALFPGHPENRQFREYFSRVIGLNLKYHIRPDVKAYQSLGGRATENLACYHFAALRPTIRVCMLFAAYGYPIPLNTRQGAKWLNWMVNCLSAPVNGRRVFPPQGAHAAKFGWGYLEIPYMVYLFAQLLLSDYPDEAQNAIAACEGSCLDSIEYPGVEDDVWRTLMVKKESSFPLHLSSEKFTGYGYLLREAVGTPEEISIHVQQLDQGPNYRWGTFRNTGNGGIHYFAAGKRYSFNALEDTGDRNLGAEEGNCGFSVLKGHTYYNIGFHDLTEPLYDFPVIKQAKLLAGQEIAPYYAYRKAALVEKDYMVLYDAVTHMRARGRFTWTVNECEDFPKILQVKPGVCGTECLVRGAADVAGDDGMTHKDARHRSKSLAFDGDGDFLTIVSHRNDIQAHRTEYGAVVELEERRDYIFEDAARSRVAEGRFQFLGRSGILGVWKDGTIKGAILDGERMRVEDFSVELSGDLKQVCAVYFEKTRKGWKGSVTAQTKADVTINGTALSLEKGMYDWHLENTIRVQRRKDREYDEDPGFIRDTRRHEFGFYGYDFREQGEILTYPQGNAE